MNEALPGMKEIMQAVGVLQVGDREGARSKLLQLWQEWSERPAPLQRCTIAHFLADTEDDVSAELEWDLLALKAATESADAGGCEAIDPALQGFMPSLHLNVGDAYRRLGKHQLARQHADWGLDRIFLLEENGYGNMIRGGLERLRSRVEE